MEATLTLIQPDNTTIVNESNTSKGYMNTLWAKIKSFLAKYKVVITTTVLTALALDIVTGIIFGFGGAALFALV